MLPVMKSNMAVLLQDEAFKELLLELPDLNFRLLAMLNPSAATSEPSAKRVKFEVNDVEDEEGEEEEEDVLPRGHLHYRFGRGRTLG